MPAIISRRPSVLLSSPAAKPVDREQPATPLAEDDTVCESAASVGPDDTAIETFANRRRVVRRATIEKGCPHVRVGSETVFLTDSFLDWLRENEVRVNNQEK